MTLQRKNISPEQTSGTKETRTNTKSRGKNLPHTAQRSNSRSRGTTRSQNNTSHRTARRNGTPGIHRQNKYGRPVNNKPSVVIPPTGENIRIIPLGGVEEVGKNMTIIEYKDEIIVVDVGFQFEEEATPGIDYILPNTKYLEERKDKIVAVFITHAHLDHIGGIPFILPRIGNPPIYTRNLSALMIKKRQEEFKHLPALTIHTIEPGDTISFKNLSVRTFPVTHSIPDSMGISIKTPHGNIVLTGDLKLDHVDSVPTEEEQKNWAAVGKDKNLLFIADSTNVERPGFSITEREIHDNLEKIIRETKGRLIIGTFASQFARMIRLIRIAEDCGRKVITDGRSIKTNIEIAKLAGLLDVKKDTIIPVEEIHAYPPEKLFILATGAQGEEFAALMRIATKKHKYITLRPDDTIVLSSSIIPGNEVSVQKLKDNLYRYDVKIIHYRVSDVHSTGHGNAGELAWINKQVGAKFFMPAYGFHSMLRVHAHVAHDEAGVPKENIIVPDNGTIIEITPEEKFTILKQKAPSGTVMVDGLSIGESQEVVIRDRQLLAQDGFFVFLVAVDIATGKLKKSPDILSRGFVYLRESQDLLREVRGIIKRSTEDTLVGMHPINFDYVEDKAAESVARFLLQKTAKRPIIIPVIQGF